MSYRFSGRMKKRIGELCAGKAFVNPDNCETATLSTEEETQLTNCLEMAQLYATLSIQRQLILTDMASLLSQDEIKLHATANNFLHLIKKEQMGDKKLLGFLTDPQNNPDKRMIIANLTNNPDKYGILNKYLTTIDEKIEGALFNKEVVVCSGQMLRCECLGLDVGLYGNLVVFGRFKSIQSMYIPNGRVVRVSDDEDLGNIGGEPLGPYFGPMVHGKLVLSGSNGQIASMEIKETDVDGTNAVRFCEKPNMDPTGYCDILPLPTNGETEKTVDMNGFHVHRWNENVINSIFVPRGYKLSAERENGNINYGDVFGKIAINKNCEKPSPIKFKKITIKETPVIGEKMVTFCDGKGLGGRCYRDTQNRTSLAAVSC